MTIGSSLVRANAKFSSILSKPGSEVAVIAFDPAKEAPQRAAIEESSFSI
jgi:hypothetical protein